MLLATAFTDDHYGRILADHLAAAGVRLAGDPGAIDHTSSAVATIGADGAASYVFDLEWRLNPVDLTERRAGRRAHLLARAPSWRRAADDVAALLARLVGHRAGQLRRQRAARRSPAPVPTWSRAVTRIAALADIVKASDEDLAALFPDRPLDEAARTLLALGPAVVVVTRGGEGASWVAARRRRDRRRRAGRAVADTIGAGDTFGAALLDALWERDLVGAEHRDDAARPGRRRAGETSWASPRPPPRSPCPGPVPTRPTATSSTSCTCPGKDQSHATSAATPYRPAIC